MYGLSDNRGYTMARMNKAQLNISVSEEAKRKSEEYGATIAYSSTSNFVETAIWYYIGSIEREQELQYEACLKEIERLQKENERNAAVLLKLLSKHPELVTDANDMQKQNTCEQDPIKQGLK